MISVGFSTSYLNIPIYNNIDVLQVTLGDPSNATYELINLPKKFSKAKKIFIHSKYTYNISKNNINYAIKNEVEFLKLLNEHNTGIVIHLSKFYTNNRLDGLKDVAEKLNQLCDKYLINTTYSILLESSYNFKHLGSQIDDFYIIYNYLHDLSKKHIGVCLDTSHLFLSGISINSYKIFFEYLALFEEKIGLKYIKLIHLNDIDGEIFGKHTQHLSILDENGKIFFNNYLILDIILNLAKLHNIPIILERNTDINKIYEEINFIKQHYININKNIFIFTIKNIIIVNFLNLLIDYYTYINVEYVMLIQKLKKQIINTIYGKKFKLINLKDEYKFLEKDINNILYNYSYDIFLYYLNNNQYKSLKELTEIKFIGIETAKILYYKYNIHNIQELINLSILLKKKYLSIPQYKALQCYKFIKHNIPINIMIQIHNNILTEYNKIYNIYIYGSIYRYINKETLNDHNIKDIDLLLVTDNDECINNFLISFKQKYMLKGILLDGIKRKSMVYRFYYTKKKNYYFILDFYTCLQEEFIYMSLYLKGPTEKNVILRKIAKSKGFILSNTSLQDLNGKKYFFNSENDLILFLKT